MQQLVAIAEEGEEYDHFRRKITEGEGEDWVVLGTALRLGPQSTASGLVFLLVFWVLAGACQRNGVGGFLL